MGIFDMLKGSKKSEEKKVSTPEEIADYFEAVSEKNYSKVEKLFREGFNADAISGFGVTGLITAVFQGDIKMVKILVKNGADVKYIDVSGQTAFIHACKTKEKKIAEFLLDYTDMAFEFKCDNELLFYTIHEEISEIAAFLVDSGFEVNNYNHYGYSPLMVALSMNNVKLAEQLIKNGADVNAKSQSDKTVMMCAIESRNTGIIKMLIDKGVDLNQRDHENKNAYDYVRRTSDSMLINFYEYYTKLKKN